MSNTFTYGKRAFGFCDRCGFRYPLHALKNEVVKLKLTGLKVCPECHDPDHPQLQLGMYPVYDPQALREPRIDVNTNISNSQTLTLGQLSPPTIGATIGNAVQSLIGIVSLSGGVLLVPNNFVAGAAIAGQAVAGVS